MFFFVFFMWARPLGPVLTRRTRWKVFPKHSLPYFKYSSAQDFAGSVWNREALDSQQTIRQGQIATQYTLLLSLQWCVRAADVRLTVACHASRHLTEAECQRPVTAKLEPGFSLWTVLVFVLQV